MRDLISHLKPVCAGCVSVIALAFLVAIPRANAAPPRPIYPNPPHLATNVAADANLSWSAGDHELIVNGTFETGNLNGWSQANVNGGTFINNGTFDPNSPDGPLPPLAGSFSSITDQTGPGSHILYQDITIPAAATSAILSWTDRIRNHSGTFANTAPLQRFKVEIRNTNDAALAVLFTTEPGDVALANPAKRSVDITNFRGQRIRIAFAMDQNLFFFNVHLDNISVVVRGAATTYDVYFGTNSVPGTNELLGSTTSTAWDLPSLQPSTTYFWRLVARQGTEQTTGTVWQFTTPRPGSIDHFSWSTVPSPQQAGRPFAATITARDSANFVATNFNGSVALTAVADRGAVSQTLLSDASYAAYASYDRATVGYAFTPASDILVTAVRSFSGDKVSLWAEDGLLLASQPVSGTPGSWRETPLASPVQLYAGKRYRLGTYAGGLTTNFARFDFSSVFPHGTINQSYEGLGDYFPTTPHPARWWFVDLVYSVGSPALVPLTPTTTGNFVNGIWAGNLAISTAATDIALRAQDTAGHIGMANRLSVLPMDGSRFIGTTLNNPNIVLTFTAVPGQTYRLERTDDIAASSWSTVSNLVANATVMQVTDTTAGRDRSFYRIRLLP